MEWKYFIGQKQVVRELKAIAEQGSNESVLIRGEYGHGKTTLARLMGKTRGLYKYYHVPPDRNNLNRFSPTLVVDEIHLLKSPETYYDMMGKKMMIFCTTTTGRLSPAFTSRCISVTLESYIQDEIAKIIITTMDRWGKTIRKNKALEVATRSHMNPRVAIMLAKRAYRLIKADGKIFNLENLLREFDNLGIDKQGFDNRHRAYLTLLLRANRPIGLLTISRSLGMDEDTILNEVEPSLLRAEKIMITSRGRILR